MKDRLPEDWEKLLATEFEQPYFAELEAFIDAEYESADVFPARENIFSAFHCTAYDSVKVLLLGQDPYHNHGQAHGLSFSVLPGVKIPPSLRNVYKELETDLGIAAPNHGHLQQWADQGIMMLNAVLTVQAHKAGSHKGKGWEKFTDAVIRSLDQRQSPLVFLLWGGFAKKKAKLIRKSQHIVIEGTHPSPLSAYNGFFGSKPFSAVNAALASLGHPGIDWNLNPIY
jgi:uracil-DNA glycosylase